MAAILASQSCYCRDTEVMNQGRTNDGLSFLSSISNQITRLERKMCNVNFGDRVHRFQVIMRRTDFPSRLGTNGRAVKMVPANEVMKRNTPNGSNKVEIVNGSKQALNGASMVKRKPNLSLVKTPKVQDTEQFPPVDELKVLQSDEGFSWANENYSSWQRNIDSWSFVLSLRICVLFDDAKWAYLGGFSEEKQKNRRQKTASWLRECVLQLGPTFIKLGQLSSTRSDLFPREFVDELAKLQDRVLAFSPKKARNFNENELGAPVDVIFKEFEDQSIAAASLGTSSYTA